MVEVGVDVGATEIVGILVSGTVVTYGCRIATSQEE